MSHTFGILPIDKPSSAPTTLLMKICRQLALPLSTPMTPSMPSILLSLTSHFTDAQTTPVPRNMYDLDLLTPTSPDWIDKITDLFTALVQPNRPHTSREVLLTIHTIHSELRGVPLYRRQLGYRICELIEDNLGHDKQFHSSNLEGDELLFHLSANELTWRIMESDQEDEELVDSGPTRKDLIDRLLQMLVRFAEDSCPCCAVPVVEDSTTSSLHEPGTSQTPTPLANSIVPTPALSRVSSELASSTTSEKETQSGLSSSGVLKAMLPPSWTMRNREPDPPVSPAAAVRSEVRPTTPRTCRCFLAGVALVNVFQAISFSAPSYPAFSVQIYKSVLSVLSNAQCTRTRLTMLQFLMRLRADRDHRLYIIGDIDKDILSMAVLVDRSKFISRENFEEPDVRRTRSISRGMRRTRPGSAAASRSRSRPSPQQSSSTGSHPKRKAQRPTWMVPESIPFDILTTEPSSTGVTTYEENTSSEWEDVKHWLPVSSYVFALVDIIKSDNVDWEILSYVLCHLPVQLSNKHFFCGPKTKEAIVSLLIALCTVTLQNETAQNIADHMPDSLRLGDAQGLMYHSLTVLISYRPNFDERKHHDMLVEAFLVGLNSKLSTVKVCLNALSICALELPIYISKNLPRILEKLARIMTNAAVAVHILDFVSIVGSLPSLYTNFREEEFKMVFAVAVAYIHHHNSPDTKGVSGRESFALSQHVLVVAYYIIYVWFLAVPLPERPRHVEFLARRLLLANEAKGVVDEPTEVCFDWLARYTYATADPRPTYSLLGDVVMNPSPRDEEAEDNAGGGGFAQDDTVTKTWLWGNSLVSIRALPKRGWIEVVSVRPSGETKFLCKLENFPQVGPGDVDPDRVTDAAIMMFDRDPLEVEVNVPDPEYPQNRAATDLAALHKARGVFPSSVKPERPEDKPDSVSGYVWAKSAPSQRRKEVSIDPSYFALQLSQYPYLPKESVRSQLVTGAPQLDSLLRTLRQTPVIDTHKIGILYVAPGQRDEQEILGNRHGSPAYTRFLESIGRLIRVRDQRDVYTGGMIPETDGEFAYAWWDDIVQVVYHTATLMPNLEFDTPRTYKKRHIGNDKVRIIWNDSGFSYDSNTIHSAFNYVNIIIEPHSMGTIAAFSNTSHEKEFFKVTMQCMNGMPEFGPIGEYKLMSSDNLGPFLRQISLLADFMSEVYEATDRDTSKHEYVTNWRRRLQYIERFRARMGLGTTTGEGGPNNPNVASAGTTGAAGQQVSSSSQSQVLSSEEIDNYNKTGFHDIRRDFTRFF
ncbi:hypothetical protein Clacol_003440 [Clathrus columnatus]|uniref:Rap-GAP domain-containing protein n=1 Tax=Clathrus columnatus TaxID=1419009 RepID=A0AAV5A7M5_9AGAM|nr:hypothetical protein Clacol_003440 [Clathrus columnatus]